MSAPPPSPPSAIPPRVAEFLAHYQEQELLRLVVVGSVDDGKSTLIGRLLHDTQGVYDDQVAAVRAASTGRAPDGALDFSLFTDGLKAEREQGITIDVAYRYFSTGRRKFIVADTPGHVQYTRNMVTGASTANVAVILVDARQGVLQQSRRHAVLAAMLGIPHLAVCINKMDLVGRDLAVFERIRQDFDRFARELSFREVTYIPVSARDGDNVIARAAGMPAYDGPTLLEYLEKVPVDDGRNLQDLRLPVQRVLRPDLDYRGLAGRIDSGCLRPGDEVVVLPAGVRTRVRAIDTFDGPLDEARAPQSVSVRLADEIDCSRGDMLASRERLPVVARRLEADLVWMHTTPLDPDRVYLLKHTTRLVRAQVTCISSRLDMDTLEPAPARALALNDIGHVRLACHSPILCDPYRDNRATGAFILIDPVSDATVAAGMIRSADADPSPDGEPATACQAPGTPPILPPAGGTLVNLRGGPPEARRTIATRLSEILRARGLASTCLPAPQVAPPTTGALTYALRCCVEAGLVTICTDPAAESDGATSACLDVHLDHDGAHELPSGARARRQEPRPDPALPWRVHGNPLHVEATVAMILDELCSRDRLVPTSPTHPS